jgi:hypothetical protein
MNKTSLLLASLFAVLSVPANAQIITWGSGINMSTDTDVATNGAALDAATFFGTTPTIVNGVTFNALTTPITGGKTDASGDISITYDGGLLNPTATYTLYAGGSANYNNVVSTIAYGFTPGGVVSLSNLKLNDTYQVEVWAYDGNLGDHGNVSTQLSGFGNGLLNPSTSSTAPEVGQFLLGDFTATGTTDSFTWSTATSKGFSIINDVSVRDITVVPEPGAWALMLAGLTLLAFRHRRLVTSK